MNITNLKNILDFLKIFFKKRQFKIFVFFVVIWKFSKNGIFLVNYDYSWLFVQWIRGNSFKAWPLRPTMFFFSSRQGPHPILGREELQRLQDTDAGLWAMVPAGHNLHCAWPGRKHGQFRTDSHTSNPGTETSDQGVVLTFCPSICRHTDCHCKWWYDMTYVKETWQVFVTKCRGTPDVIQQAKCTEESNGKKFLNIISMDTWVGWIGRCPHASLPLKRTIIRWASAGNSKDFHCTDRSNQSFFKCVCKILAAHFCFAEFGWEPKRGHKQVNFLC